MELNQVKDEVNAIIEEILKDKIGDQGIDPEKHLIKDYHIESIKALEIFLSIMDEFNIELDRKTIIQFKNINEIYQRVHELVNKKNVSKKRGFR